MSDFERERLIEIITREVIKSLNGAAREPNKNEGPAFLAIGPADLLPKSVREQHRICSVDRCTCPEKIGEFEAIYITQLSIAELADIALGRDTRPNQNAVISGMLFGVPIYLMDSALPHRKLAARCNRGFYQLLEGYVRTLQGFGITLISGQVPADRTDGTFQTHAELPTGVVTEAVARGILEKNDDSELTFRKGTVFTPSARDVFLHAGRKIQVR